MPELYIEGRIVAVEVINIRGKDKTEDFTFYKNFLEYEVDGNEKVIELNSKEDFRPHKFKDGVAKIRLYKVKAETKKNGEYKDAVLYKPSLTSFAPAE